MKDLVADSADIAEPSEPWKEFSAWKFARSFPAKFKGAAALRDSDQGISPFARLRLAGKRFGGSIFKMRSRLRDLLKSRKRPVLTGSEVFSPRFARLNRTVGDWGL